MYTIVFNWNKIENFSKIAPRYAIMKMTFSTNSARSRLGWIFSYLPLWPRFDVIVTCNAEKVELICKSDHKAPLYVWYVQRITVAEFLRHTLAVQETFPVFHVKMEVHITSQDRWLIKIRLNLSYLYMWKQLLKLLESCWNFKARISKGFFCLSDVKILLWNLKIDSVCLPTQKQN